MAFERKGCHHFVFKVPKVESLLAMEKKLTAISRTNFEANFGSILSLLHVEVDTSVLITLAQFFDYPLRCFTFRDFQLSPTIEEFEKILGSSIEGKLCYMRETPIEAEIVKALHLDQEGISSLRAPKGIEGFFKTTLEAKAQEELAKGNWRAHNAILALLVYGLVLFPRRDNVISMSAVGVFLTRNPVPTLLADCLYSLCDRRSAKKGGQVQCCIPLLMSWFWLHMPEKGPFVEDASTNWSEKLSSLSASDIRWYSRSLDTPKMLLRCEGFPNVPLIGTLGCVNYNPVLATRQLGYPIEGEPEKVLLTEFVLKPEDSNLELWEKVKRAWRKVDKTLMGKKNCLAKEAYTRWVKGRVQEIRMPFAITTPVTYASQEPEPIITVSKEEADALKDQIAKLKKENEDLQFKCFSFQGEAKSFKRERDAKDEEIQGCKKRVKEAQEREEKYKDGLASSNLSITALKEEIKGLKRSNDEMYATGNKAMIAQGDWRKKFEEKTLELKKVQQEFKKLKQEKELELLRKEKLHSQERRKDKESMQRYEESLAQITRAHEDQMIQVAEQIERLEKDLKYHKLVIEMSLQEMARWRIAFREMPLVSTSVLDEMPRMLRMAEAEVPFLNVSGAVKEFVCYCRAVVTAYKNVVKKAKKGL
ncbi:hypothetical protein QL285_046148 [Trifolium repens]|nr:hypothetical protein QL285_046148 [Trifolium repens]